MGTVIVSVVLFIIIALVVKSLCKKHLKAKKSGGCCGSCGCGCSGCCGTCGNLGKCVFDDAVNEIATKI